MAVGTVKWFDKKKGFGFVVNENGEDVFVHYSQIEGHGFRTLKDGETVEYDQVIGSKGLQGTKVKILRTNEQQIFNENNTSLEVETVSS